ncbi:MAG: SdiA-regulated domain-containing protein [Bacteroidetes bacterium]|nr:SdiA-regulated domain-containing protein [Bacteroidota bacterium]
MNTAKLYNLVLVRFFILLLIFVFFAGQNKGQNFIDKTDSRLKFIGQYKLLLPQPSGLELGENGKFLWTVSDENSTIYKISKKGEILETIEVAENDLEGVSVYKEHGLCVINERERSVIFLDSNRNVTNKIYLKLKGKINKGIEGIAFNDRNGHLFILNEKNPKLLMELDDNLKVIKKTELNFSKDCSDLHYDSDYGDLWILSDESRTLYKCDTKGVVKDKYKIDIPQMEGLAIDRKNNLIYIVSDKTANLYVFFLKK